jgi:tRNA modification GTPase
MPRTSSGPSSADRSSETIVAVASAPGEGLRAVVRLSGPRAFEIAGGFPGAVAFRAPNSYTREDLVELHAPASPPLLAGLLEELTGRGARPAEAGEFTLRAFLHGRIDLAQAEAVERLIASEDGEDAKAALESVGGAFSRRLQAMESSLLDLCADAEASIDFADQDIELTPPALVVERAGRLLAGLRGLLDDLSVRSLPEESPVVALVGPPNAGKSTLFNRLTGSSSLVSESPGTTRDALVADLDLGSPARLMDLPGQGSFEGLDGEAARRSSAISSSADAVLYVLDSTAPLPPDPPGLRGRPCLRVLNKSDREDSRGSPDRGPAGRVFRVSALTGEGIQALRVALGKLLAGGAEGNSRARFRVSVRQRSLLREAAESLGRAVETGSTLGMEFLALDLRAALQALGGVSGRDVADGLLARIFSRFCLGK